MTHRPHTRREFLAISGSVGITGFAGCSGQSERNSPTPESNDGTPTETTDETPTETPTPEETPELRVETEYRSRERYRQPGDSFEDFEDLSVWTVTRGSMEADEEIVFDGTQSCRLYAEDGENITIERELDDADLTDLDLSFAIRTTTPGNIAVYVRFVDVYGSSQINQLRSISYRTPDVGWFRSAPGVFEDDEIPAEMDQLDRMELVVLNTDDEAAVWIDDMRTHEKPDSGYVMLCWDDGFRDYYETASPMHDEFGFATVQAAVRQWTTNEREDVMTIHELLERQEAGDQIVAHGTHQRLANFERDQLEHSLRRDKEWAVNRGLEGGEYIVYPHNSFDSTVLDVASKYYYCGGFNQSGDVNTTGVHGFDPLVLPRTIGWDLDIATRCVDLAAEHRNCTILNFHAFDQENTMPEDDYRQLLEHIDDKGDDVQVITFDELWELRTTGH